MTPEEMRAREEFFMDVAETSSLEIGVVDVVRFINKDIPEDVVEKFKQLKAAHGTRMFPMEENRYELIEIHGYRECKNEELSRGWREAREAKEKEKKKEELRVQILNALNKNPHDMLLFIGNKDKVEDNIEKICDEFFYFPCELVGIEQVIKILNENEDEIYKNEDNREAINELKFAFSVHGNNMSVILKRDF